MDLYIGLQFGFALPPTPPPPPKKKNRKQKNGRGAESSSSEQPPQKRKGAPPAPSLCDFVFFSFFCDHHTKRVLSVPRALMVGLEARVSSVSDMIKQFFFLSDRGESTTYCRVGGRKIIYLTSPEEPPPPLSALRETENPPWLAGKLLRWRKGDSSCPRQSRDEARDDMFFLYQVPGIYRLYTLFSF